jgi:hypothetical protein
MTLLNETQQGALGVGKRAVERPRSAVASATGFVGVAGGLAALGLLFGSEVPLGTQSILVLLSVAVPMIVWSVLVERVHLNPTTGLDFSAPRPLAVAWETTRVKLVGLYVTWLVLGLAYFTLGMFRKESYEFFFALTMLLLPVLVIGAVPYLLLVDRYMRQPEDTLWHAGQWVIGGRGDPEVVQEHCRIWLIKGLFLSLMCAVLPQQIVQVTGIDPAETFADPARLAVWALFVLYTMDVVFAFLGYVFTTRLLDAHVRSTNPYLWGWLFALFCYSPLILFADGGLLDYEDGKEYSYWLAGNDTLLYVWGVIQVALVAVYFWATVCFGPRFSNLTHRGILTHGAYRYFKHPAYLSKNIQWWFAAMPFLAVGGPVEAVRNTLLLLGVNFIYYMRARTEEWHLMEDPEYRAYSAWIAEHGVLPRLRRSVFGSRGGLGAG